MKAKLLSLLSLLMMAQWAFSQQKITGTVKDADSSEPLIGATVSVPGSTVGAATDADGNFSITLPPNTTKLKVTYVGYVEQEVEISGKTHLEILLKSNNILQDVVVVGYITQRKEDLTGSVAVVELKPIQNNSTGNPMQSLQGRVPGLYIERDGSPNGSNGRILIRGANTLGNNDPLYIIDGIPTTRPEVFQNMNPGNIESIQVLKDASAASIYGARASNGVVIVTTKNGGNTEGKVEFQFNSRLSAQSERSMRFKMLNAEERGRALWQASVNDGQNPADGYGDIYDFNWNGSYTNPVLNSVTPKPFVGGDPNVPVGDTDWQDVMYKTGIVTQNDLTISYGNRVSSLEINLGQLKNTGMLRFTNYDRLSGSINAVTRAFNNKVITGLNLRIANSNETLTANDLGGTPTTNLSVFQVPTIPVYQKDGVTYAGALGGGYSDRNNPLHMQDISKWNNANRLSTFGNIFLEVQPVKNLFLKTNFGADNARFQNKVIALKFSEGAFNRTTNSLSLDQNVYLSTTWSNTARYHWDVNQNHQLKFLVGAELINTNLDWQFTRKEGYAIQEEDYFTLNAGTGNTTANGNSTGHKLFSQFARVDYTLADKYLAAFTVRRDGSSRFGENNRYAIFPAASFGWRIDKESFMDSQDLFSELKFRVGVGKVGNQHIGDLARFGLFDTRYGTNQNQLTPGFWETYMNIGTAYSLSGANTGTLPSGFVQTQAANSDLRWEETGEVNLGLDFALWNDKLFGSFDYFSRKTTGILIIPPVAATLGEGQSKAVNGAAKSNKGWELVLGYRERSSGGLDYTITTNFSHFRDRITELPEEVRAAYPGNLTSTIIGRSQFDIFGYKTMGLFQSQEEVNNAPTQIGAGPGRIRYVDINNDGRIDDLDRTWIGTTLPALEYGVRVDLSYKSWDASLFGSGVAGKSGFDAYSMFNNLMRSRENVGPGVFNGWTPTNTNTNVPALTLRDNNSETRTSDYFMVNTSYFKMRNIQLGYTLRPVKVLERLRLFAMFENMFWFKSKSYQGPDPERIDLNPIPIPKTYTFGINASF